MGGDESGRDQYPGATTTVCLVEADNRSHLTVGTLPSSVTSPIRATPAAKLPITRGATVALAAPFR